MSTRSIRSRLLRFAAALAVPALVLGLSASTASAAERHRGGYNHGSGHHGGYSHGGGHHGGGYGHSHGGYYGGGYYPSYRPHYRPVIVAPPVYYGGCAPSYGPVYAPAPYYAPYPYGHVGGFIGFSGPHVSVGIGF